MGKKSLKKNGILFLKACVAGGLIYWLIQGGNFDIQALSDILFNPFYIVLFLGLVGVNIIFVSLRWLVLLKSQGFSLTFKKVFFLD